jgi:hypothetical protein
MRKIWMLWLLGVVGCSPLLTHPTTGLGGGGGSANCTYSLSGAKSGSGSCTVEGGWSEGDAETSFTAAAAGGAFSFVTELSHTNNFSSGSYSTANVISSGAQADDGGAGWALIDDATGSDQGDFTLQLDGTGAPTVGNGATVWLDPSGSLSIDLPAVPGSGASGTVHVAVSF